MSLDLVIAGNLLVDDIVYPDGRTRMGEAGGAALYMALAASLWDAKVGIASVRGEDYPIAALDALAQRGVDLAGVRVLDGPGVRTWLLYEDGGRRVVHRLGAPSHAAVSPAATDFPAHYREARAIHLAPMPFEIQAALVAALSPRRETALSLDPHEPLREDNAAAWRAVLEHVDALFVSEDELRLASALLDPRAALRALGGTGGRLRFVAFKRGRNGGLLYDARERTFIEWPPVPRLSGDATGAGDAFAGGFLAAIVAGRPLETALDQAIVSASFALEGWGASGLLAATREEAERRRREWLGSGAER
jgi:sugar/nucleoside kinase (ribokinase family)